MTIKQQGGIFGRNPEFNDLTTKGTVDLDGQVTINESGADADFRVEASSEPDAIYVDGSNGNIAFGNNVPSSFNQRVNAPHAVVGSGNNSTGLTLYHGPNSQASINFATGTTTTQQYDGGIVYVPAGGVNPYMSFHAGNGALIFRFFADGDLYMEGGGNIVMNSGAGIDFSATSGTGTSELFDDYEEGTWTPVFSDASSGGNTASGSSYGYYVKVGGLVYVTGQFENVNTTGMTGGNLLYVQGIPYTPSSLANDIFFMGSVKSDGVTNSGFVNVEAIDNYAWLRFSETNNTTAGHLTVSDFASGTADIFFSLCYRAI